MTKKIGYAIAALVVAFAAGRFSSPKKVEIKEVERVRVVKDQQVKETKKETRLKDGTVIIETTKDKQTHTDKNSEKKTEKSVESRANYRVGLIYKPTMLKQSESYGLILERRLFGEIYFGVTGSTDKTVGLVLSIGF